MGVAALISPQKWAESIEGIVIFRPETSFNPNHFFTFISRSSPMKDKYHVILTFQSSSVFLLWDHQMMRLWGHQGSPQLYKHSNCVLSLCSAFTVSTVDVRSGHLGLQAQWPMTEAHLSCEHTRLQVMFPSMCFCLFVCLHKYWTDLRGRTGCCISLLISLWFYDFKMLLFYCVVSFVMF